MRIALVRNQPISGVTRPFSHLRPRKDGERAIEAVAASLAAGGHIVAVLAADKNLLPSLACFLGDAPDAMVFNMAGGIDGDCQYRHVAAMLELAGVPYTGSDALGHALARDKVITKQLVAAAGVPTPASTILRAAGQPIGNLAYPLVIKPRHASASLGLHLVTSRVELDDAVRSIFAEYRDDALVEEYVDGREVCVALLGNNPVEVLPIVEQDFGMRPFRMVTSDDKCHRAGEMLEQICPAPVGAVLGSYLRSIAVAVFRAVHCRDFATVDLRIDWNGNPWVLEINSTASLGGTASYVLAAQTAGYSHTRLINRIVEVARERNAQRHLTPA